MSLRLDGCVCLITGAGQGIGESVARGFAASGATVVATSLEKPSVAEAALNLAWDVSDPDQAQAVVQTVAERFGKIDALVANAGIYPRQHWRDISNDDWRKVLAVNLDGTWHAAQAAAQVMAKQNYGKIVTVSSIEVALGVPMHAHYDAAKAGIIGLTRSLARALGPDGIRVNALMPGAIRTPTELEQFPDQQLSAKLCGERQCIPDRLEPDDIEPTFAFLCAKESDAITGQVICADHGYIHW